MSFTEAQKAAISARGNVLVAAGAGTGKTKTLVERCLDCLLRGHPPASLDQILIVTFTDAAASEIRRRIRERLEEQLVAEPRNPRWSEQLGLFDSANSRWSEQLGLFDSARIGTLHSFCYGLIREHFYELELDPQLAIMPEEEARLLAGETLEAILTRHYANSNSQAQAVQQLIQQQGNGSDYEICAQVLKLHNYLETLRDREAWLEAQLAMFQSPAPTEWRQWLEEGSKDWAARWRATLDAQGPENLKAAECAALLQKLPAEPAPGQIAGAIQAVLSVDAQDWNGKKKVWRPPIRFFFEDAKFLGSLLDGPAGSDPLLEDWNWTREQMATLLQLTREFGRAYADTKREQALVDFHDLEQHALRLLWDKDTRQPSAIAQQWRKQLRYVFVDEYQDINEAQDAILTALGGEGAAANRFLVGDVKQSIYRFRLAAPHIFQGYAAAWNGSAGSIIALSDNFRSREAILQFVNAVFSTLMRPETGGVGYDEAARLQFGERDKRAHLSRQTDDSPRVELHLLRKSTAEPENSEGDGDVAEPAAAASLDDSSQEARLVATRLLELKQEPHMVWDEESSAMRPVDWRDMAVLLRSPWGKSENYTKEFARLGIPLTVARSGFYESIEIGDLISLLNLLDNPLQDVPALAVLHSPLAGMTADELASTRLAAKGERFWIALQRFVESCEDASTRAKVERFQTNFARWRGLARQVSLSRCLEAVLGETHYEAWLLTQDRGAQRQANVQRLLALARQFDQFQRQGLTRFLRFVEAQKEAESEPAVAPIAGGNSVSLMSIHASKGLEFPVVAVADLGKKFNFTDLSAQIIIDEKYGLCPKIKPPHTGSRYPSLPHWLAQWRHKQEILGEELRLLYVAMTRARDTLLLVGSLSESAFKKSWQETLKFRPGAELQAQNYLDWLAAWSGGSSATQLSSDTGANDLFRWRVWDSHDERLSKLPALCDSGAAPKGDGSRPDTQWWSTFERRLAWKYPHLPATREQAKTSVTALRRRLTADQDDAAGLWRTLRAQTRRLAGLGGLSTTDAGQAHHTFLQLVSLHRLGSVEELRQEAKRLLEEGFLTEPEALVLDLGAIADFWKSDLGRKIRASPECVQRELEFTARMSPEEIGAGDWQGSPTGEFIIVQGAADLAVLLPGELWLVDFKTDHFAAEALQEKTAQYAAQVQLYAKALSRIYDRPATRLCLHFLSLRKTVDLPAV